MKTQIQGIIKVSSIYVASTIGAAFASGQEIVKFFTRFEVKGYHGVFLAGLLFAVTAIAALDIVYRRDVKNSRDLLHILGGVRMGKVFEGISLVFTFCIYIVMIAGAAALWHRLTGYSASVGVILLTTISTVFICFDIKGVLTVSEILTPLMISGMLYLGIRIIYETRPVFAVSKTGPLNHWLVYAVLYVCYNSILNILVIGNLRPWIISRRTAFISGIVGGMSLLLAMYVLNDALAINIHTIRHAELPMVELSVVAGRCGFILYSLILTFALFTTAVSSGFCCVERLGQFIHKPRWVLNICMGLIVIPMAKQGFSNIIDKIYPLFGYIGIVLVFLLMIAWVRTMIKNERAPCDGGVPRQEGKKVC